MKKKKLAVAISVVLAFVITACSKDVGNSTISIDSAGTNQGTIGSAWVDSDLQGVITEDKEIRLQDDFAAAANREFKLDIGDKYYGPMNDVSDAVLAKMKKAVTDESIPGEEAEVLRKYYALSSDWDYRNSQGIEPLKPYIEDIESISSIDELYEFFGDLERNPLALAPVSVQVVTSFHTEKNPDENLIVVDTPAFTLSDRNGIHYDDLDSVSALELYEKEEGRALYMLSQLGYSDKEAKKIFSDCLVWEKKASSSSEAINPNNVEDFSVDWDKGMSFSGSFPLKELLSSWGYEGEQNVVISPRYAKKLSSLCSKGNLEKIKDYLIVNYCLESGIYLSRDIYDTYNKLGESRSITPIDEGKTDEQIEDELQFNGYIGGTSMLGALNKVYVENYFDDSVTSDLVKLTEDCIGSLGEIFSEEEWLTDEGKELCLEKLKNIKIHIAYQNFEVLDYGRTPFLSKEEGGTFLDAYFASARYKMYHNTFLAKKGFDREYWDPLDPTCSTTVTNAMYMPSTNGIYIMAGICEPSCYSSDMTYEEKLGGLSAVVGHELTHGFDKDGSLYDKDGKKNTWLPYNDQLTFNDRTDKVAAYYTMLKPYPASGLYMGSRLTGEATADMGGLKVVLRLASKDPDFDYDRFFRAYARLWRCNVPLDVEKASFAGDVHPLPFYRVNVGLQQFDEFYETYGIEEKDGMYLAPDKRIKVW